MKRIVLLLALLTSGHLHAQYRHFNTAMKAYKARQYEQAVKNFNSYLFSNPNDGKQYVYEAHYYKALSLKELNRFVEAVASFEQSLDFGHPDKMDIWWLSAICYEGAVNFGKAVESYDQALGFAKSRRDESDLLIARAQAKARLGQANAAYKDLSLAMEKNPKNETKINEIKRKIASNQFDKPSYQFDKPNGFFEDSDIESNLPKSRTKNPDAVAIVIGNSSYRNIASVDYATNDAIAIKRYLIEVLGFSEGNVILKYNISLGEFNTLFGTAQQAGLLSGLCKPNSDVFVYYSGHGYPSPTNDDGYFVPIEADLNYIQSSGYSLKMFYQHLNALNVKSLTIVLDACFSGAGLMKNVSGMKPVSVATYSDKLLCLASSTGAQFSTWYKEKQHGLFTYFFLKAIHNRNADTNRDGRLTFREIYDFVGDRTRGVPNMSRKLHNLEQTPVMVGGNPDAVFVVFD